MGIGIFTLGSYLDYSHKQSTGTNELAAPQIGARLVILLLSRPNAGSSCMDRFTDDVIAEECLSRLIATKML